MIVFYPILRADGRPLTYLQLPRPIAARRRPRPRVGGPFDDLALLLARAAPEPVRLAALERTVARIVWTPRDPAVRWALVERSRALGCDPAAAKACELRSAVYLALAEAWRPQPHRFGRRWATDHDGRLSEVVPARLPPVLFWRWLRDEARRAAEASLLGAPYPRRGEVPGSTSRAPLGRVADAGPDPLAQLVRREDADEARRRWRDLLAGATPAQRRLLEALAREPDRGLAAAARRLGLAPSTARVQWKRLSDRARAVRRD